MKNSTPSRSASARRFVPVAVLLITTTLNITAAEAGKDNAAPTDAAPVELSPMVVTATRTPTPVEETAASVTVITRKDIDESGYTTASDSLRNVPGMTLASNGPGQTVGVFTRGTATRHTSILIDGHRLPTGLSRSFDLTYFPLGNVEHIEVARGPLSSAQGGSAVGGVINFITPKQGSAQPGGKLSAEYGSFDTHRFDGTVSASSDSLYANAGLSHFSSNNDRPNNDFEATSTLDTFGWAISKQAQLDVVTGYIHSFGGVPGSISSPSTTESRERDLAFTSTSVTAKPTEEWTHTLTAALARQNDETRGSSFSNGDTEIASQGLSYQGDYRPWDYFSLLAGAERNWQDIEVSNTSTPIGRTEDNSAGFVGGSYEPITNLHLVGSARHESYDQFYGSANTWRYGVSYKFAGTQTVIHASDGTAFAAPEPQNLVDFGFGGGPAATSLEPERSRGQEVGVEQIWNKQFSTAVTAFRSKVTNLVQFDENTFVTSNVGEASIFGVESAAQYRPTETITLAVNYTYLRAHDDQLDEALVRRPRHAINADLRWQASREWLIGTGVHGEVLRYENLGFPHTSTRVEDFVSVRVFTQYALRKNLLLKARVENALDESYAEARGFPVLPLAVYGGVEWGF